MPLLCRLLGHALVPDLRASVDASGVVRVNLHSACARRGCDHQQGVVVPLPRPPARTRAPRVERVEPSGPPYHATATSGGVPALSWGASARTGNVTTIEAEPGRYKRATIVEVAPGRKKAARKKAARKKPSARKRSAKKAPPARR